jgi:hypothetical protein
MPHHTIRRLSSTAQTPRSALPRRSALDPLAKKKLIGNVLLYGRIRKI